MRLGIAITRVGRRVRGSRVARTRQATTTLAVVRTTVLLVVSLATGFIGWHAVLNIRDQFSDLSQVDADREDKVEQRAVLNMAKQSETLLGWSVLALAGVATLMISTKVRSLPGRSWAYILLGPAGALLLSDSYAGTTFQGRISFIFLRNNFNDFASLNNLLTLQVSLFQDALLFLSVFAVVFLIGITYGATDPAS
jgi:hypothetical protein